VEGRGEIARLWSDPKGSRGEGMVLLPGGHLLVAKEKKPATLIELGPPQSRSRGLVRGGALADGERWLIKKRAPPVRCPRNLVSRQDTGQNLC
jgi:hypothetical protein